MVAEGADTLVLGCTHFPFVLPLIREIAGPSVEVIEPAPAIARRTEFLIREHSIQLDNGDRENLTFATTGNAPKFTQSLNKLLGIESQVIQIEWENQDQDIKVTN